MEKDVTAGRIIVLETKLEAMQREFAEARRQHREDMDKVFAKLDDLKSDISKHVPCPAPGACLRLEQDLSRIEDDVKTLEAARNKALGERAIAGGIAGTIGAMLVAVGSWLLQKIGAGH